MKNKNVIVTLTVIISLLCLYFLSFTFIAQRKQNEAVKFATEKDGTVNLEKKQEFLDSIYDKPVYNLFGIKYTYKEVKENELALGLDLQGGMHVTLEVSPVEILKGLAGTNAKDPKFQEALKIAGERYKGGKDDYTALFFEAYKEIAPDKKLSDIFANSANSGRITYKSSDSEVKKVINTEVDDAIDRSFEILRNRIDKFGVIQPNIQRIQGTGRIQVELPGVENPQRVRNLLQGAASLEFLEVYHMPEVIPYLNQINDYLLLKEKDAKAHKASEKTPTSEAAKNLLTDGDSTATAKSDTSVEADTTAKADTTQKASAIYSLLRSGYSLRYEVKDTAKINRIFSDPKVQAMIPSNMRFVWEQKPYRDEQGGNTLELVPVKKSRTGKAGLTGEVITDARADVSSNAKSYEISMSMNPEGAKKWRNITREASSDPKNKRRVAIVLDDYVISAPVVQVEIPNGQSSITGDFTIEEARDLASKLKAGKLPAPVRIAEETIVGPSLGKEAIDSGLNSMLAGMIIVILFMVLYYSNAGLVADIALLFNLLFIVGVMANLGAVLTLPGIAGILLSIALAVDANVLINERVKEDLNEGKNLETALNSGYRNAFSAIIDSNVTTLIKGFVLLYFGTSLILGFAVTLIIGIFCSLFTSVLITRVIFNMRKKGEWSFSNKFSKNLFKTTTFDFIGKRKLYYTISGLIIVAGIISVSIKGFNLGVDFKGGRTFIVQFEKPVSTEDVKQNLHDAFGTSPEVKTYGSNNKLKITTSYLVDDDSDEAPIKAEQTLNDGLSKISDNKATVLSASKIGPTIADDIKTSAILSLVVAIVLMFLYILIRFKKWQFAFGTVVSLFHVVLVVIALFSILDGIVPFSLEIDQTFVAAILTVIGYSINDSVVVFDRIREFLSVHRGDKAQSQVINNALNDTLSRTIITGMSTIFVIIILFIFGGESIKGFSFAMLIGVLIGTYSSLCIGSPILVDFASWEDKKEPAKEASHVS
ncbi:bifunctional preprotein translocase subunit SecD/SecF [Sporocytophaga myxococcoides]|uniref:Multifunctional fusion protein n=1 Tax=Sporocytophaga myxococcoides TaxID=153721 RepID=A0A098LCY6_9BACT|nr:protein translocase subunit SecDF [Sporocytophaga myxococcoides]GAL84761.1 bifunctional preprotein translocase subunit SecD/SecF [Sporocytophaga myxococcoides]